jgi:probable F420-dependent oxidoreductase
MKFWQAVNWIETEQLMDVAKFAEEVGFHGVFNADHGVFPRDIATRYPESPTGKPPMQSDWPYPDCWATIAAMGAVTKRLRFSSAIYVLPLRNVFEAAKATGTLAILTGHRFDLGIGVGWMREEFDIYGVDFATRGKRTDEMIEVLHKLWRGGMAEHHGKFFDFPPLQIAPSPGRPVPIFYGGPSDLALRRAAYLCDGWLGSGNKPEDVPALLEKLSSLRRAAGRDHLPFETIVPLLCEPNLDTFKRLQPLGMSAGVSYPFTMVLGLRSTLDDKKRVMERFANQIIRRMS